MSSIEHGLRAKSSVDNELKIFLSCSLFPCVGRKWRPANDTFLLSVSSLLLRHYWLDNSYHNDSTVDSKYSQLSIIWSFHINTVVTRVPWPGCWWCLLPSVAQFQAFVRFYPEASSFLMILFNLSEIIVVTPSHSPLRANTWTLCKSDLSKTPKAVVIAASWSIWAIKIEQIILQLIFFGDGVSLDDSGSHLVMPCMCYLLKPLKTSPLRY